MRSSGCGNSWTALPPASSTAARWSSFAAEHYASRLVVPQSQRTPATRWSSHKDQAGKALAKLAGPHLPASLKELEKAIKRAHRDYDAAAQQHREQVQRERTAATTAEQGDDGEGDSQSAEPSDDDLAGELDVDDEPAEATDQ